MTRYLTAVVVGLVTCQIGLFVTTVFLHRALTHRAITLSRAPTMVCRVLVWVTTGIRPRQWVAVHRQHHAHTDVEGDPHSPWMEGFATVQFANAALYRRVAKRPATVSRYARDLPPDRLDRALFDHAIPGLALGVAVLWLLLGWQLALIAAAVHMATYLLASGAINAIGHTAGRRPFANRATNNRWLALLVAGEGLHNNHHAAPTSARFAMTRSQIDPGWWVVRMLRSVGMATVRHVEPRLRGASPTAALEETTA